MVRDRIKSLRRVRAGDLIPHPKNWRRHPSAQQAAMRAALAEIGFADALLVRETKKGLQLIDGHLRAELDPDQKVPVLILDVTGKEADKLLATFDPITALAEADQETLKSLLDGIDFDLPELDDLVAGLLDDPPADVVEDVPPEPLPDPVSRTGDLWRLGEHRVLCGDATKVDHVERLLDGAKAQATITDPPFAVRDDAWDQFATPEDFSTFTLGWLDACFSASNVVVVFFADRWVPTLRKVAAENDIPYRRALIWRKPPGSQFAGASLDGFWFDFEIIQVFGKPMFEPSQQTKMAVLEYRTVTGQEHGCEKPVELLGNLISGYSQRAGLILDPFLGSGTTLIAAEQLGRKCYGIEIEPRYVDVTVRRWQNFTDKQATLEGTGHTFEQVESERLGAPS